MSKQTRTYGKLNKEICIEGIRKGLNKVEAGRLAGLKAKTTEAIINTVNNQIIRDNEFSQKIFQAESEHKQNILKDLKEIRSNIVQVLKEEKEKTREAKLGTLTLSLAQIIDKIELLEGGETERIGIKPIIIRETRPYKIVGPGNPE